MNIRTFLPVLISFVLSVIFCPVLIPLLKKLKFGQQVRKEGNQEHLKKQGTPTMGGIAFLLAILITAVAFALIYGLSVKIWLPIVIMTVLFGLIGFVDDYLKVVKKQSEGFKAWQKLICQTVVAGAFSVYCFLTPEIGSKVLIPFTNGKLWDMGWLYIPFVFVAVLGTDNGTNFTDGLDGLLSSVTTVVSFFLMVIAHRTNVPPVSVVSGSVAGALMGYLLFNSYPARVFMGDTGSLAIGAFVASAAVIMKMGWFILLFGLIYFIEVLSVILQVSYFKLTHGKRIFKMAPIHHHFELSGYSETQIVVGFTVFTLFMCFVSYLAL